MKKYLLILLLANWGYGQLSSKHWIPPIHARNNTIEDHYIYLSTPEINPIQVTVKNGNGIPISGSPFTISSTTPISVLIGSGQPTSMFLDINDLNVVKNDKGLILESTKDFYVSFRMRHQNHAETLISKGRPGIGTSFRLGSIPQGGEVSIRNFVSSVMATEDNTQVDLSDYNSNVVFKSAAGNITSDLQTFILNAGESIVFSGYTDVADNYNGFIGALLTATKPVAVNTGNACGGVTDQGSDFALDQIVSNTQIGNEYIFIRGNGFDEMETPLIIADQDNTDVFVNGATTPLVTLNAGQWVQIPATFYQGTTNQNIYVSSTKPVFAYQLVGGTGSYATSGLNFIPPLSCFFQSAVYLPNINEIGSNTYSSDLMILTYSNATISINGIPVLNTLAQAVQGNSDWVTYRLNGYSGNVNVVSTGPLAVGVFGAADVAGFAGYYSGFGSAPQDTNIVVCSSQSKNLVDSIIGNPPNDGIWTVPAGGAPIVNNIFNPNVNIPGEYIYSFTKSCNTSNANLSVKAFVTIEQAQFAGNSTTLNTCKNNPNTDLFTLLGNNVTPSGTWSPALASGTSIFNPAVDVSGVYTYKIAATANCPEFSASVTVVNNDVPVAITVTDYNECDTNADGDDTNGSTTFNLLTKSVEILNNQIGSSVIYFLNNNDAINNINPITSYYGPNKTIFYRIVNSAQCFIIGSFNVVVQPKPTVNSVVTLKQCDTNTDAIADFNLTEIESQVTTDTNVSFTYHTTQFNAENSIAPIQNIQSYNAANGSVVWVRVQTIFGCFRVSRVNLVVSTTQIPSTFNRELFECDDYISVNDPNGDGIDFFNFTTVTNDIMALFPGNQNLIVKYYLSENDALSEINAITNIANFRNTVPNSQIIWVRVDSSLNNDCVGLGPYLKLTVNPLPDFDIPDQLKLCLDPVTGAGAMPIDATPTTSGNYTYQWNPVNPNVDANGNQLPIFNVSQTGNYSVIVTNVDTGCFKADMTNLQVSSEPVSVNAVVISPLFSSGLASIQAIPQGGYGEYEYSLDGINWQTSPIFNNLENGSYIIYARDVLECGIVQSNEVQTITYPNYFTPNADGYNDTWNIIGLTESYNAKLYIFDRYGKLIKQINPYDDKGWDGTINGSLMPSTDYWFKLEYTENGQKKEFKSHFSLKR